MNSFKTLVKKREALEKLLEQTNKTLSKGINPLNKGIEPILESQTFIDAFKTAFTKLSVAERSSWIFLTKISTFESS